MIEINGVSVATEPSTYVEGVPVYVPGYTLTGTPPEGIREVNSYLRYAARVASESGMFTCSNYQVTATSNQDGAFWLPLAAECLGTRLLVRTYEWGEEDLFSEGWTNTSYTWVADYVEFGGEQIRVNLPHLATYTVCAWSGGLAEASHTYTFLEV